MLWASLFLIGIVQGVFLISLVLRKGSGNILASRLLVAILVLMAIMNLGYLAVHTDLRYYAPQLFSVPFGFMFLYGPLFFLYAKSVLDDSFRWEKKLWLHFIPYAMQFVSVIPFFLAGRDEWLEFLETFRAGDLPVGSYARAAFVLQLAHFLVYLSVTFRWMQSVRQGEKQYVIPYAARMNWVKALFFCLSFFFATVLVLCVAVIVRGAFHPVTNYVGALVSSAIVYFIAYRFLLNPDLISPDFTTKYRTYMQFAGEEGEKYLGAIRSLMRESRLFTDPDLTLSSFAERLTLPPHQVSKLINEKFGKSFSDFVNEHRVEEFISRINDPKYKSYTLYGLALEVGFSSKSSFNTAFKKVTGKNPSEYKVPA